jgi:hypothetical protein
MLAHTAESIWVAFWLQEGFQLTRQVCRMCQYNEPGQEQDCKHDVWLLYQTFVKLLIAKKVGRTGICRMYGLRVIFERPCNSVYVPFCQILRARGGRLRPEIASLNSLRPSSDQSLGHPHPPSPKIPQYLHLGRVSNRAYHELAADAAGPD